jgi:hypothetical protein
VAQLPATIDQLLVFRKSRRYGSQAALPLLAQPHRRLL